VMLRVTEPPAPALQRPVQGPAPLFKVGSSNPLFAI
jgi:hypothetical protein